MFGRFKGFHIRSGGGGGIGLANLVVATLVGTASGVYIFLPMLENIKSLHEKELEQQLACSNEAGSKDVEKDEWSSRE